ncbi:phthiodiolone/phenolphthiodiolone dimycocerosates ketoreductase [Nocardia sputorum]|uniref:LLM class flavin-dependent oxidoreductase n=1 Tax=Nocardia sputorum TaxID=2984338 RepID=UPI002493B3D5|nr:LLM class flavin-dependent oxidoreductase [Nocardia sputorum]BDT91827.1 phthiodiolone/phenolphthiodiolone dimycocerosates ketoreductase [Nocardia sputorum]
MAKFRTGVMDSGVYTRFAPDLQFRGSRSVAMAGGADSLWVTDHLPSILPASIWKPRHVGITRLAPHADGIYEPWTALGYLAAQNRLARLRLGVGVTDAGRRNPAVTAQAAATLHHLSRGRAILGIGTGIRDNNEPYGVDWTAPVGRFEEALATIRALWDSHGSLVNRDSPHFPLRDAVFDVPPYRDTRPEIWVAAGGPRMLRAAGRYADVWFPGFAQRPHEYRHRLELVRAAASDAGRDPLSVAPAAVFSVLTATRPAEVDALVESVGARALTLCAPGEMWTRHGATHPLGEDFTGLQDYLPQTLDERTVLDYVEKVPPSLVREFCLTGTPEEIVEQVADWRDHGLRYAVLMNLSAIHPNITHGMISNAPLVATLRKLKKL